MTPCWVDLPIFKPIMRAILCEKPEERKAVQAVITRQQAKVAAEVEQQEQQASASSGASPIDINTIENDPAIEESPPTNLATTFPWPDDLFLESTDRTRLTRTEKRADRQKIASDQTRHVSIMEEEFAS